MAAPTLTSRILRDTAKRRLAASSVAPVASGYERCLSISTRMRARFSRPLSAICSGGDR